MCWPARWACRLRRKPRHAARAGRDQWRISMISLATLALGLAIFGLFFALVALCDRL
jgi:hypothetical protein